jgi:predicted phage terminase large subunit-like protein
MLNNFKPTDRKLDRAAFAERVAPFAVKLAWFLSKGYMPHYRQMLFHTMRNNDKMTRFRHLVAGRRGGKTLSAAWEVLFYCLHPEVFHYDAHGREGYDRPLHVWVLTKDYPTGRAAWRTFEEVLRQAGLSLGTDYKRNLGDKFFEFANGSLIEFKTADDPESLRGAGLDFIWMDEAAFISGEEAWLVARPALSDKQGLVISTTTPHGKNWFYETFWSAEALVDEHQGRVEYWSIQNPYFPRDEWEYIKKTYHPLLFKQEYMASFDSMMGVELHGDWLNYYEWKDIPRDPESKKWQLRLFMGIDPAISLSDKADRFAMALIGVDNRGQVYLIDQYAGRIPFPDQVQKVLDWYAKWRDKGLHVIGIESNAYQAALEQQIAQIGPVAPIIPVISKGKKQDRIMRMSHLFRIGKVKIRSDHRDFVDEWVNYDSTVKNTKDDCLDSVEIALATAGALLPELPSKNEYDPNRPVSDLNELARLSLPGGPLGAPAGRFDPEMGADW